MVSNSIKSDIVPTLDAGAAAIHVSAHDEWNMKKVITHISNHKPFKAQGFKNVQRISEEM